MSRRLADAVYAVINEYLLFICVSDVRQCETGQALVWACQVLQSADIPLGLDKESLLSLLVVSCGVTY